jgi:flagellar basal-body rod protein FlgB
MKLFDSTLHLLERSLDARLDRHNVLSSDLANADTPGYVPLDVDFGAAMRTAVADEASGRRGEGALAPENRGHAPSPVLVGEGAASSPGIDGNRVDADRALVALAENGLQYGASARAASKKLAILRYVASDGNA